MSPFYSHSFIVSFICIVRFVSFFPACFPALTSIFILYSILSLSKQENVRNHTAVLHIATALDKKATIVRLIVMIQCLRRSRKVRPVKIFQIRIVLFLHFDSLILLYFSYFFHFLSLTLSSPLTPSLFFSLTHTLTHHLSLSLSDTHSLRQYLECSSRH